MTKPKTPDEFSSLVIADFTWRLRELSDLKLALRTAPGTGKPAFLRALVVMCYAHWEGHAKFCGERFIEFITMRRLRFSELIPRYYEVRFDRELGAENKSGREARASLVRKIGDSHNDRFSNFPRELIYTGYNLNSEILEDLSFVCGVDFSKFAQDADFIDRILLKRRNEVCHGDASFIDSIDGDDLVIRTTSIMRVLRDQFDNAVALQSYRA